MGLYKLGTFKENFGVVQITINHHFFTLIKLSKLNIDIYNKKGHKLNTINGLLNKPEKKFQILKKLHQYQLEQSFENPMLLNCESYIKIENIINKYSGLPSFLFILLSTKEISTIFRQRNQTLKSIALNSNSVDFSNYKYLIVVQETDLEEIILQSQVLLVFSKASFNVIGCNNSLMRVENQFIGNIRVGHLEINKDFNLKGNIMSPNSSITIQNKIDGDIHVNKLHLGSDCEVNGDIIVQMLIIESGATFNGTFTNYSEKFNPKSKIY